MDWPGNEVRSQMLSESQIKQAAQFLLEEHEARKPFGPFPEAFSPRSIDEAYARSIYGLSPNITKGEAWEF